MLPLYIKKAILEDDRKAKTLPKHLTNPKYHPKRHFLEITHNPYYYCLTILRHHLKLVTDYYFGVKLGAKNVDLFMLTPSISSPSGAGSDSKPIKIKFGRLKTFLVDSSQFGFEPLLLNNLEKVYCYLPSMRGENPDSRHLNQFYHCEMEMIGKLNDLLPIIERYIKILAETMLLMKNIIEKISENSEKTKQHLEEIIKAREFSRITFDKAVNILVKNNKKNLINSTKHGKDISYEGEIELIKILKTRTPMWLTYFNRNRVPFYQKPDSKNPEKTINADLLFPPIIKSAFGGEVVGSGQRQDNAEEIYESLKRQKISPRSYEWYINLRKQPNYKTTSGFGLGVERFIAWVLGKENVRDVILYPRLKNIKTCP